MGGFSDILKGAQGMVNNPMFAAGASIYSGAPVGQAMGNMQRTQLMGQQNQQQAEHQKILNAHRARSYGLREETLKLQKDRFARGPKTAPNADLRRQLLEAQIKKMRAGPQKDELKQLQAQLIRKAFPGLGGSPAAPSMPPRVAQPMANPMQVPPRVAQPIVNPMEGQQDPNLIKVQSAGAPQPAAPQNSMNEDQRRGLLNSVKPGLGDALVPNTATPKLAKPTIAKAETAHFNASNQLSRMDEIYKSFKPEYLETDTRVSLLWNQLRAKGGGWSKMLGQDLSPDERKGLREYATFRSSSARHTNLYIKEITGAQMSEAEAKRIMLGSADAGQGVLDGQDPETYKANLDSAYKDARLAQARMVYLRRTGRITAGHQFTHTVNGRTVGTKPPVSLEQMEGIMDKRANALMQEAKFAAPQGDSRAYVRAKLKQEFGI